MAAVLFFWNGFFLCDFFDWQLNLGARFPDKLALLHYISWQHTESDRRYNRKEDSENLVTGRKNQAAGAREQRTKENQLLKVKFLVVSGKNAAR